MSSLRVPARGDIVISTLRKSGHYVAADDLCSADFQTPDLPAPMSVLSPWMESDIRTRDQLYGQLAGQQHRRFIKSHGQESPPPARPAPREWLLDWITEEALVLNAGSPRYAMWHLAAAL
jgi:hypothetical protein